MEPSLDTTWKAPEHVHWRRFDAELVVIDLRRSEYFGLNDVAADAFEKLVTGRSTGETITELGQIYDVEVPELRSDITHLVALFAERGLLVRREQAPK
jgi:hypothetical protein